MLKRLNHSIAIKDLTCKSAIKKMPHEQVKSFKTSSRQFTVDTDMCHCLLYRQNCSQPLSEDSLGNCMNKIKHRRLSPAVSICHHLHNEEQISSISCSKIPYRIWPTYSSYHPNYDQIALIKLLHLACSIQGLHLR